jgi:hypothetical protein
MHWLQTAASVALWIGGMTLGCSAPLDARAEVVESADGLRLELSSRGRVTGLTIGQTTLPLHGVGGFALADFKNQPEPVNLIPNPGFEAGAVGWRLAKGQTLDSQVFHSGRTAVRLELPGPQPASSNLEVVVPVKPNQRYRVGLWMRRANAGVCGAYSSERDDRNRLTGKVTQLGASIPRQDGVWLPLSWEITTEPKTTRLSLRADIYRSTGTLWVDDYFVHEVNEGVYEAAAGETKVAGGAVTLNAALRQRGLELQATVRPDRECLRVDGWVRDTTGEDRAIGVKFALPLDLAGWTWYQDAEERETIEAGRRYALTYKCLSGIGVCSIYPWLAVSGPRAGLSLALPLDQGPRVFLLQHDQTAAETALVFFFGLAKDAGHHPSRAPFRFVIYRHDPAWGMRSAMQTYYRLFPQSFLKRPPFEGYLNYADAEQFDPLTHQLLIYFKDRLDDASDFGEGYQFVWHLHGCYDFHQVPYADSNLPADETVRALLAGLVKAETARPHSYTPCAETLKKIAFGPRGQISYIGDTQFWRAHEGYNHTGEPGWGFNFRVDEDPQVSPFLAEMARRKAQEYARSPTRRDWGGAFTADAIEGYMSNAGGLDYRREHFRTTLVPLTFGCGDLRPALPNTIWDFHHKAWWPITQQYKIVTYGNANGYEQFFTMPYVDVPMTEGSWDPQHPARLDRFLRAINYRKIWRHWHAWDPRGSYGDRDEANVQAHFRHALAYAIYPAVACVQSGSGDLEPHRALYRQYVPAIEELSRSGWDPVPYARAGEDIVVERFGDYEQGELHFTLRNYEQRPIETLLTLDRQALGIPADAALVAMDILPGNAALAPIAGAGYPVSLDADGSRAFWIGTRSQAVRHGFRMAVATLEKIERMYAGEMRDASKATWSKALSAARAGTQSSGDRALKLAEELQQMAVILQSDMATRAPVDMAKLLFRLRAQLSLVPVAMLEWEGVAPQLIADVPRGGTAPVAFKIATGVLVDTLTVRVISPWDTAAKKCTSEISVHVTTGGDYYGMKAGLWVPADPPRRLMPYLLEIRNRGGLTLPFTVAMPVDVQVAAPLDVRVAPERVLRGRQQGLRVTLRNRLDASARVTLKLSGPRQATFMPAELLFGLPARGTAERSLTLDLEKSATIGDLRLSYQTAGADPRFGGQGAIFVSVGEPVANGSGH